MTESALERVLRLANGITRPYTRLENGRVQRVGSYVRTRKEAWGSLKAGTVVQLAGVRYKVIQAKVPQTPFKAKQPGPNTKGTTTGKNTGSGTATASQGAGVNTGGPSSTASPGQAVNTGAVTGATIAQAVLGGVKLPYGTPTVTNLIQSFVTGKQFYVYLPPNQAVTVIS